MYLHVHVSVVYNQHGLKKTNYHEMYLTVLNMYSAQHIIMIAVIIIITNVFV